MRPTATESDHLRLRRVPIEAHPGGLLAADSTVRVCYPDSHGSGAVSGKVVDVADSPAPYISVERETGGRVVIFLGPGVTVEPLTVHPAA